MFTLATLVLAPLLNFGIGLVTGFDVASLALYTFIPVGTFALCALACGGFLLGSMRANYSPDAIDLPFLMIVSVGAIVLTYLVDYAYLIFWQHATSRQLGGFGHFVVTSITEARYQDLSSHHDSLYRSFGFQDPVRAGEGGFLVNFVRIPAAAAVAKIVHSTMVSRAVNLS